MSGTCEYLRGFNPPPPFQAREHIGAASTDITSQFQSTPAFSGEGTNPGLHSGVLPLTVSIHPRLFRRGNRYILHRLVAHSSFNPPPPFQAREPPEVDLVITHNSVSIHPRLFRRGNRVEPPYTSVGSRFNPPPPFQAREHPAPGKKRRKRAFQSTPAFSGEGTR